MRKIGLLSLAVIGFGFVALALPVRAANDAIIINEVETRVDLNSATVTWLTDVTTTGLLEYGTVAGTYTDSKTTSESTSHSVILSDLSDTTTYYYRITADDGDGNTVSTAELSFTTESNDLKITRLEIMENESRMALIEMRTNKSAYYTLVYGTTPDGMTNYASNTLIMSISGVKHQVFRLTGLAPNTTYYYQAGAQRSAFLDPSNPEAASSGIGILATSGRMRVTGVTPTSGRRGTIVTIAGENFGRKPWNHTDVYTMAAVGFGCTLSKWPDATPKCRGKITSWTNTQIVVQLNGGEKTGRIYVAKGAHSFTETNVNLVTVRGPVFTVR